MYYILRLPSHDFVAHVLDSRSKDCYLRDEDYKKDPEDDFDKAQNNLASGWCDSMLEIL